MARHLHALLQSSIVKRNTRSRTFWMQDNTDEDVNFNTSYIGKGIHTPMTRGLIIKTYTPPTFSKNSILLTLLRLDKLKYKRPNDFTNQSPSSSSTCRNNNSKDPSAAFISISLQSTCPTLPLQSMSPLALLLLNWPTLTQATPHFPRCPQLHLQTTFQFCRWILTLPLLTRSPITFESTKMPQMI